MMTKQEQLHHRCANWNHHQACSAGAAESHLNHAASLVESLRQALAR
jgi:hypothetical protein